MTLIGSLLMALFPPKERRKNRGAPPQAYVLRYTRLHKTLMNIANKTQRDMTDAEFRRWVQDAAHKAITDMGEVK